MPLRPIRANPAHPPRRTLAARATARLIVVSLAPLAAQAWLAHAGVVMAADAVPWLPDSIASIEPYAGPLSLDHFAGPDSADQIGSVTAALGNGDRLVVGLVPKYNGANPANGLWNLGLVRYDAAGHRVAWSNPGDHGFYGNQYVIYPGSDAPQYQYVRDVKVQGGWIYILVDVQQQSQSGRGRQDVRIIQVREDGSTFSEWPVFGYPPTPGVNDHEDFYGAQMAFMSNNHVIVGATAWDDIGPYVAVTRLVLLGNGAVSLDDGWGEPYGGANSLDRIIRYFAPDGLCAPQTGACNATAGYTVNPVGFPVTDDFYVAGSMQYAGDDWDAYALKISSLDGIVKTEFSPSGWVRVGFDQPGSSATDYGAGLYVYRDEVYLAAQVAQKCHPGVGMAKLDGASGDLVPAFGNGGMIVFGGQGDAPFCFSGAVDDVPYAMSATGGRLGIVGFHHSAIPGFSSLYDPMLAVVDAVHGSVLDLATHPVRRADGSRLGDAVLYSVYGGPDPASPVTVAGNGRDASAGNTLSYLSGRLGLDRIFGDGFD